MRQILQNARSGRLELSEVPAPTPGRGQLLVQNRFSVMSPGTDKLAMDFARKTMLGKARSRPDLVKQVMAKLQSDGPLATYRTVTTRLDVPQPMGYSCAGVVTAVGPEVQKFSVGDRVACAGAGYACHAELIVVPENLVAPVPADVVLEQASFATLGAIALQGIRVADPTLGEIAAVIGLGLIGQLSVQLLRANGCRVLGIDLNEKRAKQALEQGATWAETPSTISPAWKEAATDGYGVDLAVVTASARSAEPLHLAAELCRQKGRIASVGAMPLELERRTMYEKELDLRMSMSYGPGRYDRSYEEMGLDYPLSYVRWTENRNMRAFVELISAGSVQLEHLDTRVCAFRDAVGAYEDLVAGTGSSLAVVFRYEEEISDARTVIAQRIARTRVPGNVGVGFIGAGSYARGTLLPALDRTRWVDRLTVVTTTGASAKSAAQKFGFSGFGTDTDAVLKDPNVELVFIATRHETHAALAEEALRAGKAVWLEKPAALRREELDALSLAVAESGGFLSIGYNRRFSSHTAKIQMLFGNRRGPMSIHYSVAAGPVPRESWIIDPRVGGGRIVGELCHFVDLCNVLVGENPDSVFARALGRDREVDDSVVVVLSYPDASVATIEYLAQSSPELPKERFEVSGDGLTARCENFRRTELSIGRTYRTFNQDKGQTAAVATVVGAVRAKRPTPLRIEDIRSVSLATFAVLESVARGEPISLSPE